MVCVVDGHRGSAAKVLKFGWNNGMHVTREPGLLCKKVLYAWWRGRVEWDIIVFMSFLIKRVSLYSYVIFPMNLRHF